jgi:hypothetical protein
MILSVSTLLVIEWEDDESETIWKKELWFNSATGCGLDDQGVGV